MKNPFPSKLRFHSLYALSFNGFSQLSTRYDFEKEVKS